MVRRCTGDFCPEHSGLNRNVTTFENKRYLLIHYCHTFYCDNFTHNYVNFISPGERQILEEARTMDYVTNHNMITMAMSISKH